MMGFHICEYCDRQATKPALSSGDVVLEFDDGHRYIVPDMIVHYVEIHAYCPPAHFVRSVLFARLVSGDRQQTKSVGGTERIGYLSGAYQQGHTSTEFCLRLRQVIEMATEAGDRMQTRGAVFTIDDPYDTETIRWSGMNIDRR